MTQSAHRAAVEYFEQALTTLPHLAETRETCEQAIDLRLALRPALFPLNDSGRILALLREAEVLAEALDDPRRLGRVLRFLSVHCRGRGAPGQDIVSAQRALALAIAGGDGDQHAAANHYLGLAYQWQGDYRRAIDCQRQHMAFYDRESSGQVRPVRDLYLGRVASRAYLAWCHAELARSLRAMASGTKGSGLPRQLLILGAS
jgi:hypothetical protein